MKSLDDHLEAVLEAGIPGVVALAADPAASWEKAAGLADIESGAPLSPAHRFRIGSVTKLFVATVVLQLVGEGALALDDEVGPIADGVTLRQLLNHTSGLPDHYADLDSLLEPYRRNRAYRQDLTPRAALELVHDQPRLFPPGTGWSYSNGNFIVLGLLVEETTGATLREELRARILEPLALEATDLPDEVAPSADLTRAYLPADNPLLPDPGPGPVDVTEIQPFGWGGGELVSTARDVARFLQALLGGELLAESLRAELLSTVPSDWEESVGYGLGIEEVSSLMGVADSPCGTAWGHIGFSFGYTTIALASKSGDRRVVILTNTLLWSDEAWPALGGLTWACYCGLAQTSA